MGLFNVLAGNVSSIDVESVRELYDPMLCEGEVIERAFSHIRDKWVFTNKRLIMQNTQGVTGKKKDFFSVPYHSIEYFSIETAGTLDEDSEMKLWVRGMSEPIKIEFARSADIMGLQQILATHVLR